MNSSVLAIAGKSASECWARPFGTKSKALRISWNTLLNLALQKSVSGLSLVTGFSSGNSPISCENATGTTKEVMMHYTLGVLPPTTCNPCLLNTIVAFCLYLDPFYLAVFLILAGRGLQAKTTLGAISKEHSLQSLKNPRK